MAASREAFRGAVERVLDSWTVLKLAVSHGFGGVDSQAKAEWMVHAVDQWFSENANIETYELEDFLADVLNHEFDTVADDGSLQQMSQMICGCYKLCADGNEAALRERLDKLPKPAVQNCVQQQVSQDVEDDADDDSDENGMNHDPPPVLVPQPTHSTSNTQQQTTESMETEEDDGWETVGKKGKRR